MDFSTRLWPPAVACTAAGGVAAAIGGLLTWIDARGARPTIGMNHTSLSGMLVWSFHGGHSYWASVGFAVLVLGVLIVAGALTGLRTLAVIAALLTLAASQMWIGLTVQHFNAPNQPNSHYLNPANLPWSDLREGAWLTICGGVVALLSAFALHLRGASRMTG